MQSCFYTKAHIGTASTQWKTSTVLLHFEELKHLFEKQTAGDDLADYLEDRLKDNISSIKPTLAVSPDDGSVNVCFRCEHDNPLSYKDKRDLIEFFEREMSEGWRKDGLVLITTFGTKQRTVYVSASRFPTYWEINAEPPDIAHSIFAPSL